MAETSADQSVTTLELFFDLAADYLGTYLVDARGWRFRSPGHFAERHGLIIIIALGESIVAIGVGVTDLPISWPILVASLLGLAVSTALWWIYFDAWVRYGERALAAEPPEPVRRWPGTRTRSCICRWSPASSCSPSG